MSGKTKRPKIMLPKAIPSSDDSEEGTLIETTDENPPFCSTFNEEVPPSQAKAHFRFPPEDEVSLIQGPSTPNEFQTHEEPTIRENKENEKPGRETIGREQILQNGVNGPQQSLPNCDLLESHQKSCSLCVEIKEIGDSVSYFA
jgi:hypothetical protein